MPKESAYFTISKMADKADVKRIKNGINTIPGVTSVSVNAHDGRIAVDFDNSGVSHERIEQRLLSLGYQINAQSGEEHIM